MIVGLSFSASLGLAVSATFVVVVFGVLALYSRLYQKVNQGQALILNRMNDINISFQGALVIPIIHRAEVMDISVKTIEIARTDKEGLICKDNIRADIRVTFFLRVNAEENDVKKVAASIGAQRASHQDTLEQLFAAKFAEALKTVGKQLDFEELYTKRHDFKEQIKEVIGEDLNGYRLEDAAIDFLEQTPISTLAPDNILDARGIRKITEITAGQAVHTNELRREAEKQTKKKDVETREAILELERQEADAMAKQAREVASVQAREQAETKRVQAEESRKAELARIKLEEEVAINEENKQRQIEVAQKNRERVIAVEQERVLKDQSLEAISRERETELKRIAKEKALEVEKKEIEDVIRARVIVNKARVEEEERIKDVQVVAAAKREKDSKVIHAEAEAEEHLVAQIKQAEAQEESAKFKAREKLTLAEADLEAADKQARAKIRLAEGAQAEYAAEGLAKVRVREADAVALEKEGDAKARVSLGQMKAEAEGRESQGLALVRVKEAEATAIEKTGQAEAGARRDMMLAEANGREAEAVAVEKMGAARAVEVREKLVAEATGLEQKAAAMKQFDEATRSHEEFRLRLEKQVEVQMREVEARENVAGAQASVIAAAMSAAKINIVGGDGEFFQQFINAVSVGKSLDGMVDSSGVVKQLMGDYLNGERSLPSDIKDVLSHPALDAEALKNLSVTALLTSVAGRVSDGEKSKVQSLIDQAKRLGL